MGKRAPEKNRCITVNLHHDGVFTVSPFEYLLGDEKQITDIHFEGTPLKLGIKIIKTDSNVDEFVNFGYRKKRQELNLGSLVTYRWIAHHYAKQLIADPFIPTLKMKSGIRDKFLINEYRHAILDSNPGSTCRLDDEETESGHYYFKRIYVCFKGVKECWLAGCRKVIGLDGCFLKHTCRGELLVAMGRDANKQMYPIAWAAVKNDASTTVEQLYISKMEELKVICPEAYQYLIKRNPNSWCRAYFRHEPKCPNFENGICESFNRAILVQRTKPIIIMLEDIRLYIMQRLIEMNRVARNWEHTITPSIRKRLELLKIAQRDWMVIPSGFGELEVRKGHESYGVNIHLRKLPKPPNFPRPPAPRIVYKTHASVRVRGRGQGVVEVLLEVGVKVVKIWVKAVQLGCHKEEEKRERVKEEEVVVREEEVGVKEAGEGVREAEEEMTEDGIRKKLEHDYIEELLLQEEQKLQSYETEQDELDQEALRLTLEEEAMYKRMDEESLKEKLAKEEWDRKIDYYHPSNWTQEEESFNHEPYNRNVNTLDANVQTQESVAANMSNMGDYEAEELGKQLIEPIVAVTPSVEPISSATHSIDKGKQVA
ncbi:hypothetical protein Tco_0086980 [Tanacetum coccineum]